MKELTSSQNEGTDGKSTQRVNLKLIHSSSLIDFVRAQLRLTAGKEMLPRHILSNSSILRSPHS